MIFVRGTRKITKYDIPNIPFKKIAIDVVDMEKDNRTAQRNRYIITIQCMLTRFVVLYASPHHTVTDVFRSLINLCTHYNFPRYIVSDNGPEFAGNLMQLFSEVLDITNIFCMPYHPEGNGALERFHGKLKEYLLLYVLREICVIAEYA